ncbi:hypothetical protein GCM10010492_53870 [Saccharothrix mutabilis subsp. mutabilis]|uniref:Uncharacterized protein n=1 Tax=Saccharothrix mutabilis subsp. mutabilis TaxID=66855 RepID=A0ABN0UDV9_9PSEU
MTARARLHLSPRCGVAARQDAVLVQPGYQDGQRLRRRGRPDLAHQRREYKFEANPTRGPGGPLVHAKGTVYYP